MIMNPPNPPPLPHAHPPQSSSSSTTKKMMIMNNNPPPPMTKTGKTVIRIREVWANNLKFEFKLIQSVLRYYFFASMDTEFPGVVYNVDKKLLSRLSPYEHYSILKTNVDNLNIIQVGLTLSNANGDLPIDPNTGNCFIWEFNFSDFDVSRDRHAPDSIELLKKQGIDFDKNREKGIKSTDFAQELASSGLVGGLVGGMLGNFWCYNANVTWITFHSAYDFGYLIKILTQKELPNQLDEFMGDVRKIFGPKVYDIKYLMKYCDSLYGGLDRVAKTLNIDRAVGKCHQAGSDSLLTLHTFIKIREKYFKGEQVRTGPYSGVLYGLEVMVVH